MAIPNKHIHGIPGQIPNLPKRLFWDWEYNKIDWDKGYSSVIARVLERGDKAEWLELVHFYGEPQITTALKEDIKYLPDYALEDVCSYFNLKKEELACYTHKQSRKGHWL